MIQIRGITYQKDGRQFILDTLVRNLTVNGRLKLPLEPTGGTSPAPAPAAAPADNQPAPVRRPEDEQAMINAIIKDRVRYVFLFNYVAVKDPKPGVFDIIGQSYLRDVVSSAPAAAVPGQPVAPATGGARGIWPGLVVTAHGRSRRRPKHRRRPVAQHEGEWWPRLYATESVATPQYAAAVHGCRRPTAGGQGRQAAL